MNAIVKAQQTDEQLVDVLRSSLYPTGSRESITLVLGYCRATGLDPMKKPVHIVPMWNSDQKKMVDTIMPGIGLYRIEAARTGDYAGKSEPEFGPDVTRTLGGVEVTFPLWCKVTVQRFVHGEARSYTAKELWLENYATAKRDTDAPNAMWKKRAYGQLAKCAESQALRMAFPEQTGGTNTAEEMDGKSFEGQAVETTAERGPAKPKQVDHVQLIRGKLDQCGDQACVIRVGERWRDTIGRAAAAGRPIAEEVQEQVNDMLGAALGQFQDGAPSDPSDDNMPE